MCSSDLAAATHTIVEMVEEGVIDHAEDGDALVDQAQRYACEGEAVYEVSRPVYSAAQGGDWWVPSRSGSV